MKISNILETIPTPDEAGERARNFLAQNKGKRHPVPPLHKSDSDVERDNYHRDQDRKERSVRDHTATANEDSSQVPEPGNNIRTKKNKMEGKVERISRTEVFFRLADGRLMKTPMNNVIVIEKLADEDDGIMEDRVDEISNEVLTKYKAAAGKAATAADKAGDIKTGNKRFSGIVQATKKQFANDAKKTVQEGGMGGVNRCAPSNDVSYQDILNDVTDKWKGDTVKVNEISTDSEKKWVAGANKWRGDQTAKGGGSDPEIVAKADRRAERTMKIQQKHGEPINELSVKKLRQYSQGVEQQDPATTPKYKLVKHAEGHAKANGRIAHMTGDRNSKAFESKLQEFLDINRT